jgi:hypothetical protein
MKKTLVITAILFCLQLVICQQRPKENQEKEAKIQKIKLPNKWIGKYSTYFSYGKIGGEKQVGI